MTHELTLLDLFSGIGGFSLGFEREGFRTVGFCEIDPAASRVLEHWWPGVPNFRDVRTVTRAILDQIGPVDVITGGVPCQPASALGHMRGTTDERWLWPEAIRVVGELRPRAAVFENPPALLRLEDGRAWDGIVNGLAALGYDSLWEIIPAAIVGAGHLRERLFLIAVDAADSHHARPQGHSGHEPGSERRTAAARPIAPPDLRGRVSCENWWHEDVTGVPVLVHGIPHRLAEAACRCTGNAVVPQVAQIIARALKQLLT